MRASSDMLVRVETSEQVSLAGLGLMSLSAAGTNYKLEPLFEVPSLGAVGAAPVRAVWHRARATGTPVGSIWDAAYEMANSVRIGLAAQGVEAGITYVEPDLIQEWPSQSVFVGAAALEDGFHDEKSDGGKFAFPGDATKNGPKREFAWHLNEKFTGLGLARLDARAHKSLDVRIAHLDVGYGFHHKIFPAGFDFTLAKNATDDGRPDRDVEDLVEEGMMRNPGHGTGTIGLLAGGNFTFNNETHENYHSFEGQIGAAPDARIVGVRVGNSVVQIRTSSVAQAIAYVADLCKSDDTRVHVLSMSMGGVASQAWADAVNLAYERGVVLVTAAGNNYSTGFGGFPTTSTVYPARFARVLSARGVMGNRKPYFGLRLGSMQGNWGPQSTDETSLAAYTPNTSWARRSDDQIVDMDGAGTSSATPQIAGAAGLYLQKYGAALFDTKKYPSPWMRVEAVRAALLQSADREFPKSDLEKLGIGALRANAALQIEPISAADLEASPPADVSFPFLSTLFGLGASKLDPMLQLEMAQLVQQWEMDDISQEEKSEGNPFDKLLDKADRNKGALTIEEQHDLARKLILHRRASTKLKSILSGLVAGGAIADVADGEISDARHSRTPTRFQPTTPKFRCLRGYALDPSFAVSFATQSVSETVYQVPWEDELRAGPCDEYVQVIDIDPSSRAVYEPVDLNHSSLLATLGIAPSQGTPQFHQQMVYAVARTTIDHFEAALGRKALWRPRASPTAESPKDDSIYVKRLRIYPHAFRGANAYYSPNRIALMFGYFRSRGPQGNGGRPQQIFTCLSQDVVAHETTHALLDGMHRTYLKATNPDVLAFHEAFADIVALLQRLGLPELLKHQIAQTRGEIRSRRSLLGELATQFGQAMGERGGLREAIGTFKTPNKEWAPAKPTGTEYESSEEPHARGSILVAAVFDAFLSIYERRTEDLVRIATDGSGILRLGAIHPDLVARLADEANKSASHVLRMCIRALDYCPPTDITFGEYLRAIITADFDLVPDDDLGYRVAFIEAFGKRGIPVDNVPTIGVDSLLWRRERDESQRLSPKFRELMWRIRASADAQALTTDRESIFHLQRKVRDQLHTDLKRHFKIPEGLDDACLLGLIPELGFEVHTARFASRVGPDGQLLTQAIIVLLQEDRKRPLGTEDSNFEGGCTIISDLSRPSSDDTVRYVIRKSITSQARFQRQSEFALAMDRAGERQVYLMTGPSDEPFAALHARKGSRNGKEID